MARAGEAAATAGAGAAGGAEYGAHGTALGFGERGEGDQRSAKTAAVIESSVELLVLRRVGWSESWARRSRSAAAAASAATPGSSVPVALAGGIGGEPPAVAGDAVAGDAGAAPVLGGPALTRMAAGGDVSGLRGWEATTRVGTAKAAAAAACFGLTPNWKPVGVRWRFGE